MKTIAIMYVKHKPFILAMVGCYFIVIFLIRDGQHF